MKDCPTKLLKLKKKIKNKFFMQIMIEFNMHTRKPIF